MLQGPKLEVPRAAGAEGWPGTRRLLQARSGLAVSDCVWVGPSVLGEARGAQIEGFLHVLALSSVAE